MPGSIRYETLPLAYVHVLIESDFYDNCIKDYGPELGIIIFNWMCHSSLDTFDNFRSEIKQYFLNRNSPQHFLFFYRLDKIIRLYQYWNQYNRWRDPVVAIPNTPTHYFAHPGKDRLLVMKSLDITHYRFLVIERDYISEENLDKIRTHWGAYDQNLSIDIKYFNKEHKTILNKDSVDLILQFVMIKKWLASKLSLKDFIKSNPRDNALKQIVK
jgi:hypothetical protein